MSVAFVHCVMFGGVVGLLVVAIGLGSCLSGGGPSNKANAADCPSEAFIELGVVRQVISRFDNVCWQTTDSRRDVLCRVESYGIGFSCSR